VASRLSQAGTVVAVDLRLAVGMGPQLQPDRESDPQSRAKAFSGSTSLSSRNSAATEYIRGEGIGYQLSAGDRPTRDRGGVDVGRLGAGRGGMIDGR
jgi:hypothetical protein